MRLPKPQKHKKASLSKLLTLALFLVLIGLDLSKGYLLSQSLLRPYFPSLPHLSRFLRVLQSAQSLLAHLVLRLAQGPSLLHVVDSKIRVTPVTKPLPMALGHRIRGYALVGVIHDRGLFHRWALLPGMPRRPGPGSFWRA